MTVFAPGKLVLTGAYAVLEGAPAIVVATSLGAYADASRPALSATPEVRAALGPDVVAPHFDASDMFVGARKLGLGASAAILVASLGAREAATGADLASPRVREQLFKAARRAHAEAQSGGSGVDIAASVYGGALRYTLDRSERVSLPRGLGVFAFACGTSARTSELRAEVDRLTKSNPSAHRAAMGDLSAIATVASAAVAAGDAASFVESVRRTARSLAALGELAGAPIVPAGFDALEALAAREEAAFCVAGAGGGDVAVFLGCAPPSRTFIERAHALGLFPLELDLDEKGVRTAPAAPAAAGDAFEHARPPHDS